MSYAKLYFSGGRAGVDTTRFAQQVRGNFSDIFAYGNGISGTVYIDRALIEAYLDGRAAISRVLLRQGRRTAGVRRRALYRHGNIASCDLNKIIFSGGRS